MVGFVLDPYNFFFYIVATTVLALVGDSMVKAVGALVKSFSVAAALASICMTIFMLFSGFFVNPSQLPKIWRWYDFLNYNVFWTN
jgi:ABC-type multidrug transport system permease subunit